MRSIVTDKGVDLLYDVLQQSQSIKTLMQQMEDISEVDSKEDDDEKDNLNRDPKTSVKGPNSDGDLILSRKKRYLNQQKKEQLFNEIKSQIKDILNRMTEHDYIRLSEEGFRIEDLTIETLISVLEKSRESELDNRTRTKKTLDDRKTSDKKENRKLSDQDIINRMKSHNLPVTKETVGAIKGALNLSESIPFMDKKDALYLLQKNLSPSIENLYKARYSSQSDILANRLSDKDWNELADQVRDFIHEAGIEVKEENLDRSRWLLENNLPLTKNNINFLIGLDNLRETYDKDLVLDKILMGMREGSLPGDVVLLDRDDIESNTSIDGLIEDIQGITEDDIIKTIGTNKEITIKNLVSARDDTDKDISLEELTKDQQIDVITAKRQLEEIRLKMTAEAALRMEKKGFNIDTQTLERVVEELRLEEDRYFQELYKQEGIDPNEDHIQMLRSTTESVEQLKSMPMYVLGVTLNERSLQSIGGLVETGKGIISELTKAKESYETLMTQPRSDYGDSIYKAFNNLGSLMEEMGIEDTVYNQRALRILGYSQMEITKENIEQIKAYDLQVNHLMRNLHPSITVKLIKEGINPMNLPIDELNQYIENIMEDDALSSLEKYSTYLYRLEKEEAITEAERKAYIGIYRLLYQIEKSDGAALGALVKSNQEVTLNNLLTSIRTLKKGRMDYKVDDSFGTLQDLSFDGESITDQIGAIYNNNTSQKYVVKELLENLTPAKLHQLDQRMGTNNLNSDPAQPTEFWETLGDMSIEHLLDQTRNMQDNQGEDKAYYSEKLKELRDIYSNCDQSIRFLNDLKFPCTTTNLMLASQILNNGGSIFKKLFEKNLKKKPELSDTLINKKTMNEAYEELEQEVKDIIEKESNQENMDSAKLTELKNMGLQIKFIKNMAKREFYQIPLEVSGKITNINLTIIRRNSNSGSVTIKLESERLGYIKAEASLKDNVFNGYIACDHNNSLNILREKLDPLKDVLQDENIVIKQLNLCMQKPWEGTYIYQNPEDLDQARNPETERILYRIAKTIINVIASAEEISNVDAL